MNCSLYVKSSVSARTVARRANDPAKDKKKETNDKCPVDLFFKLVNIWGRRDITTIIYQKAIKRLTEANCGLTNEFPLLLSEVLVWREEEEIVRSKSAQNSNLFEDSYAFVVLPEEKHDDEVLSQNDQVLTVHTERYLVVDAVSTGVQVHQYLNENENSFKRCLLLDRTCTWRFQQQTCS